MTLSGAVKTGERINLARLNFLLLDHSLASLEIMAQILTGFGVQRMTKCQTALEAKNAAGRLSIDFLLADGRMPDDDGFVFLRWLRRETSEPNRFAPAVLVTGDPSASVVHRARDAGAHFTVAKPLTPAVLLQRICWIARESRSYVDSDGYVGPDRRFSRLGPPPGLKGRRSDDINVQLGEPAAPNLSQDEINAFMKPAKVTL
jgi:CheY-like chemotaxis protein